MSPRTILTAAEAEVIRGVAESFRSEALSAFYQQTVESC